jgi:protein-arginine kinase
LDSYTKFAKLFDKVIEEYHQHPPTGTHKSNMEARELVDKDFTEEQNKMVVSTRIRVGRNCEGYPLGPGVTKEQRLEIMNKVTSACETFEGDLKGTFYPLEGMSDAISK